MTAVVVVDEAEQQLREIVEWWTVNRPGAPTLPLEEFERCLRLLASSPDVGGRFHQTPVMGVRRLVMKQTRHHLYYVHDAVGSSVPRRGEDVDLDHTHSG